MAARVSPSVTICLLTYGDYAHLVRRALDSVHRNCNRIKYTLVVGANAVSKESLCLLEDRVKQGEIDRIHVSPTNLGKSPMMRRMFAGIQTEFVWWFDDDAYLTEPTALSRWLQLARSSPPETVIWGQAALCEYTSAFTDIKDATGWVRNASWYRGLPPPSWKPGGKGVFNYRGKGTGDGRWFFILGGCFMVRTATLRAVDWPDPRLFILGDDAFFGEAIRQQGWDCGNIGTPGVFVADEPSRGTRR